MVSETLHCHLDTSLSFWKRSMSLQQCKVSGLYMLWVWIDIPSHIALSQPLLSPQACRKSKCGHRSPWPNIVSVTISCVSRFERCTYCVATFCRYLRKWSLNYVKNWCQNVLEARHWSWKWQNQSQLHSLQLNTLRVNEVANSLNQL